MPPGGGHRPELEPRAAWQPHLRAQAQERVALDVLDAPEVDRVAWPQRVGVAPPAAQPDASERAVHEPADLPQPVHGEPATLAAEARERPEHRVGRRDDVELAPLEHHPLLRAQHHRSPVAHARGERVAPRGVDVAALQRGHRAIERLA